MPRVLAAALLLLTVSFAALSAATASDEEPTARSLSRALDALEDQPARDTAADAIAHARRALARAAALDAEGRTAAARRAERIAAAAVLLAQRRMALAEERA
ncbi:MAG: hypothetical protein ACOC97_06065, partial [Myxococcota bacterium]